MKTVLPLRYLIVPIIVAWAMVFITAALFLRISIEDWGEVFAWASLIALVGAFLFTLFVVPFVARLARGEFLGFGVERQFQKDAQFVVRAENLEGTQVDFFRGLTPEQWHKCAKRLQAHIRAGNRSFTFAVVGQTERPILVPVMFAAGYIKSIGKGEYELTNEGRDWWLALAATPFPYDHAPKRLQNLPMGNKYI